MGDKLVTRALIDQSALIRLSNLISAQYRAQPVRDDSDGFALRQRPDCLLNGRFIFGSRDVVA